jgi:hypothetical protein
MASETRSGRAREDKSMVKYRRICLPLLGRAMANQVATK